MKKTIIIITAVLFLFSCQKEKHVLSKEDDIRNKISLLEGSISSLSDFALKSGIYNITAKAKRGITTYTSEVANTVVLNGEKVDFSSFVFTLDNGELKLDNYSISLKNGDLFLKTPLYSGYMKAGKNNDLIDTKTAALMLLYSEISKSSNTQHKTTYAKFLEKNYTLHNIEKKASIGTIEKKALFDTRQCGLNHAVVFGWSRETTVIDLTEQLSETDFYKGCTKVGGIATSCIGDEHACVSSQSYRCPC